VSLADVLRKRPARAETALHDRVLGDRDRGGRVAGILVGHTHFDHAIDVPELARRFDTGVYGSSSLAALMALYGMRERAVVVIPEHRYELGPFEVTFFPSLHSKLLLGYKVPFDGELTCEHLDALAPGAYRCGQVYGILITVAGISFYHQGSAYLFDDRVPRGGVDVFLAGIAGRSFTPDYWPRILRALAPETVVASHFDDFFRSIDAPFGFSTNVNLAAFPEEVASVSGDFRVAALRPALRIGAPQPMQHDTQPSERTH
jgi:L-ascorbate metabolism protein UlaG (beta-lactamase superfamily)